MPDPLTTSVVVVTGDPANQVWLSRCVSFLLSGARPPDQVLVVVDDQPELAGRLRDRFEHLRVTVLESAGRGDAAAMNTGLALAEGDIVAFLQDDLIADFEWLARLVDALSDGRAVAAAAHVDAFYLPGARPLPDEVRWLAGAKRCRQGAGWACTDHRLGTASAFRRQSLADAGGFPADSTDAETTLVRELTGTHGPGSVIEVPEATARRFVPRQEMGSAALARTAWRYGPPPVPTIALERAALRHLARWRPREAWQCALVGVAIGLGHRFRQI